MVRSYILVFLVLGLQSIAPFLIKKITGKYNQKKDIFRYYIQNNTRTQDLNIQNGDVSKLISDGFIYLASQVSYGGMRGSFTLPVNITDWTWHYIHGNPEVLD